LSASTICFANIKGGVGKTTLTVNVAHVLAQDLGRRVLVVDMDPQLNATTALLPYQRVQDFRASHGSVHRFFDTCGPGSGLSPDTLGPGGDPVPVPTGKGFDLILGALDTAFLELRALDTARPLDPDALRNGLRRIGAYEAYDHILIDTPPTPSFYLVAALKAADRFVSPAKPDHLSIQGLGLFARVYQTLCDHRDFAITALPLGVILTLAQNPAQEREGRQRVAAIARQADFFRPDFFHVFDGCLPLCAAVTREQESQRLILELPQRGPVRAAAIALRKIAGELSRKLPR
jgi:chromosome partitioning protein